MILQHALAGCRQLNNSKPKPISYLLYKSVGIAFTATYLLSAPCYAQDSVNDTLTNQNSSNIQDLAPNPVQSNDKAQLAQIEQLLEAEVLSNANDPQAQQTKPLFNKPTNQRNPQQQRSHSNLVVSTPATKIMAEKLTTTDYQTVPLETIVDPNTGVIVNDTYAIQVPSKLSLLQAQHVLTQVSPKLASNKASIAASQLQADAARSLDRPSVFLRAGVSHYDLDSDVDISGLKQGINDSVDDAVTNIDNNFGIDPNVIPNIPPILSNRIPDNYNFKRQGTNTSAGVAVVWPVYTAGRTKAVRRLADARTDESIADSLIDDDELQTTLVDRYFGAQLALIAAYLREDALNTIKETNYMTQRLLEEGFISRVDRLEAKVALAEAESEAMKANNQAALAMTSLQRLLRTPTPVKPVTPLFVSSQSLPELSYFQAIALQNHPGLKKVAAKYAQAESLSQFSDTGHKPNVNIFGYHQLEKDPSWIAGVSATWKLWGGLDSDKLSASSQASVRQALLAKVDVSDNIKLLVEKNWLSVENARVRYYSLNSNVQLAEELLRLKKLGLVEGMNTALDVTTAQTRYLQARTEQAATAYEYVQSLAALMQSCGTPQAFNEYMTKADIRLPTLY